MSIKRLERVIEVGKLGEPLPDELPYSTSAYDPEIVLLEWRLDLENVINEILTVRERSVLLTRFGFDDGVPKTLDEIGKFHGVTSMRIGKLLDSALIKLSQRIEKENSLADLPALSEF